MRCLTLAALCAALIACSGGGADPAAPAAPVSPPPLPPPPLPPPPPPPPIAPDFADPRPVQILSYGGEAMEPFLSRDGQYLFFNNRNEPGEQTELHWAERVDDLTFRYRGLVDGANAPDVLDGVPTLSSGHRFCFISPRSYQATLATVHCGDWRNERVEAVTLQTAASPGVAGRVVFDVEISADGAVICLADGRFEGGGAPQEADLRLARLQAGAFVLSPADDAQFAAVNTSALEYAAAISADGLELAFTRASGVAPFVRAEIWIAKRAAIAEPFAAPIRVNAIESFAEGPTFSPDGRSLYYHRERSGRFEIWRVVRP